MLKQFSYPIWEEIGVERPTPAQVRHYMLSHGWHEQSYGPEGFAFAGPRDDDQREILQMIPSSEGYMEYPQRLTELLRALSLIERRLIRHILADMLAPEANGVATAAQTKARRP